MSKAIWLWILFSSSFLCVLSAVFFFFCISFFIPTAHNKLIDDSTSNSKWLDKMWFFNSFIYRSVSRWSNKVPSQFISIAMFVCIRCIMHMFNIFTIQPLCIFIWHVLAIVAFNSNRIDIYQCEIVNDEVLNMWF